MNAGKNYDPRYNAKFHVRKSEAFQCDAPAPPVDTRGRHQEAQASASAARVVSPRPKLTKITPGCTQRNRRVQKVLPAPTTPAAERRLPIADRVYKHCPWKANAIPTHRSTSNANAIHRRHVLAISSAIVELRSRACRAWASTCWRWREGGSALQDQQRAHFRSRSSRFWHGWACNPGKPKGYHALSGVRRPRMPCARSVPQTAFSP